MRAATIALLLAGILPVPGGPPPPARAGDEPAFEDAERLLGNPSWKDRLQGLGMLEAFRGDPRAEKAALKLLEDYDWEVVIRAAGTLGKVGGEASRDPLVRLAIEGEIAWIRRAAAEGLRAMDPGAAQARLLATARVLRDPALQARALDAAGIAGAPEGLRAMASFASSREAEVSAAAVRAAGRIGAASPEAREEAVSLLRRILGIRSDRKYFHSYAAGIEGLGRIPVPETTELLLDELARQPDDDGYVPERIARGLETPGRPGVGDAVAAAMGKVKAPPVARRFARLAARLGLREARPELVRMLASGDERARSEAVRALGLVGGAAAAADVRALLERDPSPLVRREAVIALARLLDPEEFRGLGPAVAADEEARVRFVVELMDRGDAAALPVLAPLFQDRSWRVASAALAAAGALGAAPDLPLFGPFLAHRDWRVRGAAFEALGRLRARDAIPMLSEGLRDRDPVVRGVCHANLQILTKQKLPPDPAAWSSWWERNGSSLNIAKRSRRDAAEVVKEERERDRYGSSLYGQRGVEILQKARILVVLGAWDHAEKVLAHLKIPATSLRAQQIKDAGLNPNQVVLINCEGNLDKDSAERIQWFVNVGGYAMTTDWALAKAVQACFPGYAEHFPGANTGNDVVVVEEASPGHPFTAGVFENVPAMKWWLEIQAFPIRITCPERVEMLVDSAEMRQRYGSSPMAFTFRWGLGKVQHSLSHFALQEEGMTQARGEKQRKVFAADHLGLSMEAIRDLDRKGAFAGSLNEETMKQIAPDYSMFRLIVNVVAEKSKWVEDL